MLLVQTKYVTFGGLIMTRRLFENEPDETLYLLTKNDDNSSSYMISLPLLLERSRGVQVSIHPQNPLKRKVFLNVLRKYKVPMELPEESHQIMDDEEFCVIEREGEPSTPENVTLEPVEVKEEIVETMESYEEYRIRIDDLILSMKRQDRTLIKTKTELDLLIFYLKLGGSNLRSSYTLGRVAV